MSSNNNVSEFLEVLGKEFSKNLKVEVTSQKNLEVKPMSFKQQKAIITSGLNGLVGAMTFIKNINDTIIENTGVDNLKIYDRMPIILALRQNLFDKKIVSDDVEIDIADLIKNFTKFDGIDKLEIEGEGFSLKLRIPTLVEENRFTTECIEMIKKTKTEDLGENASIIISYEIPKFLESVTFKDNTIDISSLSFKNVNSIIDNLPASITNKITDFILKVREYDEKLLTINDVTIDVDYSFFE